MFAAGAIGTTFYDSDVDGIGNYTASMSSGGENCRQNRLYIYVGRQNYISCCTSINLFTVLKVFIREESCVPVHQKKKVEKRSISNY